MVRFARTTFDVVTGYREQPVEKLIAEAKAKGQELTVEQLRKDKGDLVYAYSIVLEPSRSDYGRQAMDG